MSLIAIEIGTDGPHLGRGNSLISISVVYLNTKKRRATYFFRPIGMSFCDEVLTSLKITRELHQSYPDPSVTIEKLIHDILQKSKNYHVFISTQPHIVYMWLDYYCLNFWGKNPFSQCRFINISDVYGGAKGTIRIQNSWYQSEHRRILAKRDPLLRVLRVTECLQHLHENGLELPLF